MSTRVGRIHGRRAFQDLRREGRWLAGLRTRVRYLARPGGVALALAVPRSVGTAVVRNRVRRRFRAAADEVLARREAPEGWYLVQISSALWAFSDITREFEQMFDAVERTKEMNRTKK